MVLTVSPKKASYRNFDESLSDIVKEIKVTTTNMTELRGSKLIDQFATKSPELIHSKTL